LFGDGGARFAERALGVFGVPLAAGVGEVVEDRGPAAADASASG
jgi:hypothetical protein